MLAQENLANRLTDRALGLAVKAATATGRYSEALTLAARARDLRSRGCFGELAGSSVRQLGSTIDPCQ